MKPYVIKLGDYVTKLAHTLGFDADSAWNHPKNAELKKLRVDRDMLVAGDILFVPEKAPKQLPFTKESENAYVAKVPKIEVTVTLEHDGKPIASEEYIVEGLGDDTPQTTDGDGNAALKVPVHVREVVIRFTKRKGVYRVRFGELDPATTPSGARQRLTHLGIYMPPKAGEGNDEHDGKLLGVALAEFQRQKGIQSTGELDDATSSALAEAHGS